MQRNLFRNKKASYFRKEIKKARAEIKRVKKLDSPEESYAGYVSLWEKLRDMYPADRPKAYKPSLNILLTMCVGTLDVLLAGIIATAAVVSMPAVLGMGAALLAIPVSAAATACGSFFLKAYKNKETRKLLRQKYGKAGNAISLYNLREQADEGALKFMSFRKDANDAFSKNFFPVTMWLGPEATMLPGEKPSLDGPGSSQQNPQVVLYRLK